MATFKSNSKAEIEANVYDFFLLDLNKFLDHNNKAQGK